MSGEYKGFDLTIFFQGAAGHDIFVSGDILDPFIQQGLGNGLAIMTDRWQKFTKEVVTLPLLEELSAYCDEFLVHAVDVEGKNGGIETGLVRMLSDYDGIPVTYAGGVHSWDDIDLLKKLGKGKIDMTIGSALDLFGGTLSYERLAAMHF